MTEQELAAINATEKVGTYRAAHRWVGEKAEALIGYNPEIVSPKTAMGLREAFVAGAEWSRIFLFLHDKAVGDYLMLERSMNALISDFEQCRKVALDTFRSLQEAEAEIRRLKGGK